jgi:hypothetical protein
MSEYVLKMGGREYRATVKELTPERATIEVNGKAYHLDLVQLGRRPVAGGGGGGEKGGSA